MYLFVSQLKEVNHLSFVRFDPQGLDFSGICTSWAGRDPL